MIATNVNSALSQGQSSGNLKLSGYNLESLDVLWDKKNKQPSKINYSFDSNGQGWWETADFVKVDLSDNSLSQLDERISEWENVKTVDLRKNSFTGFPKILCQLPALTKLNISRNKIDQITVDSLNTFDLDASYNSVFFFSISLPNIQKLDLCHNQLKQVPECIQDCRYLSSLNLSYNSISDADYSLDGLKSLCDLDLSHNSLATIFNNNTNLPNLARLALNHNALSLIPPGKFMKLTDLSLSYNQISGGMEESILNSSLDLQVLDIGENKLEILPESILLLHSLKRLDISNNSIRNFPPELGLLSNIQTFSHFGNPAKVPNGFGTEKLLKWLLNKLPLEQQMTECKIKVHDMMHVDLSNSSIVDITSDLVQNMPRSLKLSNNLISCFDIIFDFGTNLSILELAKNRIKEFPTKSLPSLTVFDL